MFSNKALKKLILPLIIEQILIMAVGVADTVMVSYAGGYFRCWISRYVQ